MDWLIRKLITKGISKGLVEGNRAFTILGLVAFAIRVAQRAAGSGEKTLLSHELEPGESLVISSTAASSNKGH